MGRAILVICVTLLLLPASVSGQQPSTALPTPEGLPTIFVLDRQGTEYRGKLIRVDADRLVVLVDAKERTFHRNTIRRIHKRGDSLKNGAAIGAITGAALGVLAGAMAGCPDCVGIALVNVGIYTAAGAGLDAAIQGRTLLYEAPDPPSGARAPTGAGLVFRLQW